jgi:hypothetical protein
MIGDLLKGPTIDFDKAGPQNFMPFDDFAEGGLKAFCAEPAREGPPDSNIQRRVAGVKLIKEPEPFLRGGTRDKVSRIRGSDCLRVIGRMRAHAFTLAPLRAPL